MSIRPAHDQRRPDLFSASSCRHRRSGLVRSSSSIHATYRAARSAQPRVSCPAETEWGVVADHDDFVIAPEFLEQCGRPVGRTLVHDDQLVTQAATGPEQLAQ